MDSLDALRDVSRPEGWGDDPAGSASTENGMVYCGGMAYQVEEMVTGKFKIDQTKGQVYGKCVQSIITDLIKKMENKDHELMVTIENAYESLKIALLASE